MPSPLRIAINPQALLETEADAILLPVLTDGDATANSGAINSALDGLLEEMYDRREFRGEPYQVVVIPTLGRLRASRLLLVGLGKQSECTPVVCQRAVSAAIRTAGKRGIRSLALDAADFPLPPGEAAAAAVEGAELGLFTTQVYRTAERKSEPVGELLVGGAPQESLDEGAARGRAKNLARELVNEPANYLDPSELARRATEMAAASGLGCRVLDEAEMEQLGMGAILTVTRGSETPARFIVLEHRPRKDGPLLALIGKAVCFDTGGISIKPSADMGKMKGDMAGGAAVIGAMQAIAALKVPVNVLGLVPAVVNMPDGRAWLPGDVITAMSGKTIETLTTDAEGRMLLADALCYAQRLNATHMVDIATLTGACMIALGHVASGLFGTSDEFTACVQRSGEAAGERHWPMPLYPEYRDQIISEIADIKNSGGRPAGAVTAAWFLREFAGETPWAHLDIAGSANWEKTRPWAPAGPTGTGVGTFINLARLLAQN